MYTWGVPPGPSFQISKYAAGDIHQGHGQSSLHYKLPLRWSSDARLVAPSGESPLIDVVSVRQAALSAASLVLVPSFLAPRELMTSSLVAAELVTSLPVATPYWSG